MDPWLLATDVDDTLAGDDEALARFAGAVRGAPIRIVLNSSRPVADVAETAAAFPDELELGGIIGALGTEVRLTGHDTSGWKRPFAGFDAGAVAAALEPFGAQAHPARFQGGHKASFAVPAPLWPAAEAAMQQLGFPVRVIASGASNFDVIPAGAGKGTAVVRVAALLGIPAARVITAGDSENDADALVVGSGIVVANATTGLRSLLGNHPVIHTRAPGADGIVEGLRRIGALPAVEEGAA